jgi:predicted permease
MPWARRFWLKLQGLFRHDRNAQRLDAEIQFHLDQQIAENVAAGMSPEEARYAARRAFGNPTYLKEETRHTWGWVWLEQIGQDLRYAARTLRKSPGFTLVAVLTLALGIGANTAIFSLVNTILLRMLPVPEPQQLVEITRPRGGVVSYPFFEAIRDRNQVFSGVLLLSAGRLTAGARLGGTDLGAIKVSQVSGNYFEVLGVSPAIGRVLTQKDHDTSNVAVIGYGLWQRAWGGDPSVLGKTLQVGADRRPYTIVGVTPANFTGLSTGQPMDLWVPVTPSPSPDAFMFRVVARRKPGSSEAQALANVELLGRELSAEWHFEGPLQIELMSATSGLTELRRRFARPLLVLMLISAMLLLMVSLNIGNLLLARASARQQEVGVRLSLGASRSRLVRQLLTESFVLGGAATALGLLLAPATSQFLVQFISSSVGAYQLPFSVDGRMLAFTLLLSIGVVLLFGTAPALAITRRDLMPMFLGSSRASGLEQARRGKLLMVAQVAISCVLLAGATLFVRSLLALGSVDAGFNPENVLLVHLGMKAGAPTGVDRVRLFDRALQRFETVPGVESAAMSSEILFSGNTWTESVNTPGFTPRRGVDRDSVFLVVSPGFFRTMGTSLVRGRDFSSRDDESAPKIAVVNEAMARYYFGTADPVGRTFRVESSSFTTPVSVVGLVQNAKYKSLKEGSPRIIYLPALQTPGPLEGANFEIRTRSDPGKMADLLWNVAHAESPYFYFGGSGTQEQAVEETIAQERMLAELSGFIGLFAAVLVCLGIYGLTAYQVSRRTHEIGIRVALGASPREVLRLVVWGGLRLAVTGLALGIAAAIASTRLLSGLLFDVNPSDPVTFIAVAILVCIVAVLACCLPARRAMRVDPMVALRYE